MNESCFFDIFSRELQTECAVVSGMIVGTRNEIKPCPFQFTGKFRRTTHPRAAALRHGVGFIIMKKHFEVGEGNVCRPDNID